MDVIQGNGFDNTNTNTQLYYIELINLSPNISGYLMNTKFKLILVLFLAILSGTANSQTKESERIKGVADFLIDRANDNFLYIFEQKLKNNKMAKTFFPNTFDILKQSNLKVLLTSTDLWEETVENDVDHLMKMLLKKINNKIPILPDAEKEFFDAYWELIQNEILTIRGTVYKLDRIDLSAPQNVKDIINSFYTIFHNGKFKFLEEMKKISFENIFLPDSRMKLETKIDSIIVHIEKWESFLHGNTEYKIQNAKKIKEITAKIKTFSLETKDFLDNLHRAANAKTRIRKVISTFNLIEYINQYIPGNYNSALESKIFKNHFEHYKKFALFFTQLSEASDAEEVNTILRAFTLPPVSFGIKREPRRRHLTVSSYLGFTGGFESKDNGSKKFDNSYFGLSAPIGLEWSFGFHKTGSFSLLGSILDFGSAVNSQLYDTESNARLKDLVNPGVFLVYGLKKLPIAVGAGYYKGKGIRISSLEEHHFSMFVAFDMPLFVLY